MRYFLYILIAGIILYILLDLSRPKTVKKRGKSNTGDSIKSYDKIRYLGGNPQVDITEIKEGSLHIYKDTIVFDDSNSELLTILIRNISKCSMESDPKTNKSYVSIRFSSKQNSLTDVILQPYFNDEYSKEIVEEINNRMKYK